jgi:PKHD-type hydroxylase
VIYISHKVVPNELCDITLEALDLCIPMEGYLGSAMAAAPKWRQSKVRWLRDNELWHDLHMFITVCGRTYGMQYFDMEDLTLDPMQLATYEIGDFYDWHKDATHEGPRRLSLSLQLSNDLAYEGGYLEFKDFVLPDEAYEKGSVIMFNSDHEHRITPITKGTRHSLVGWFR